MELQDKVIPCVDCKKDFVHTVETQKEFAQRGFSREPKRCPECRIARKEKNKKPKGETAYGLGPIGGSSSWGGSRGGGDRPRREGGFRSGGGGGYRGEGGGEGHFGGPSFGGPRQSYDAICATCGQKTTVPFEPTQGRDVYCRDCFKKKG